MLSLISSFMIILLAGFVQGMTSFGFSLVAVPLLGLFIPLADFVPMLILFSFLLSLFLFTKLRGSYNPKRVVVLALSGISFTQIGINMLKFVDNTILKMVVGVVILLSSILMLLGIRFKIRFKILGDLLAGASSGILNGSLSLSGPPVILLLSNEATEKEMFRKTLAAYFLALNLVSLPLFFASGLLSRDLIIRSVINLPALFAGMLMGLFTGNRISEGHFKKITLVMILILGLISVLSAKS